ncbi:MAG: hypothetical protein WAW90_00230, partial [Minisyncoccia bacterium]
MKKELLSVVLAVAICTLMGVLVVMDVTQRFAFGASHPWIIAVLVAAIFALIAYVVVDFKPFCAGVARSYRISAKNIADTYREAVSWEPFRPYWKALVAMELGSVAVLTSGIILISLAKYTEKQLSGSTVLVIVLAIAGGILIALSIVA